MSLITDTATTEKIGARKISAADFWLLLLRGLVALPMFYYQGWTQALKAWRFVWEGQEWDVAGRITSLGIPQPAAISVTVIFLLLAAPLGILTGFLTRINGLVLLVTLGFVLFTQLDELLSATLNPQSLLLYLGMALVLSLSGGGLLSLDALMTRRRYEKNKKRGL